MAVAAWAGSLLGFRDATYQALHDKLVADGSINGREAWVSDEGSFGRWEGRGVEQKPSSASG